MRILYVGPLEYGGTCLQRMVALRDLGHDVLAVDTAATSVRQRLLPVRVLRRCGLHLDLTHANARILDAVDRRRFDVVWVDKGLCIHPRVLAHVKEAQPDCKLVSYSPDDMLNPRNQSRWYLRSVPIYDLHVTTKSYNVKELKQLGAKEVLFIPNAYDPHTHRPVILTAEERSKLQADVGFIGAFERERFASILALAEAGIHVTVRGPGWPTRATVPGTLYIKPGWVLGDDYAKAICATKINLCFLRKANRDRQTTRSVEIPACGGFMLAERTDEHLTLFREGKEAEFFSTNEELIAKTRYYLIHEEERQAIALAGRERCIRDGYTYHDRLAYVLRCLCTG